MLKARDAKYSVPIRYGKVLFCGAAAAEKSNFLHLLMKEDFQELHISTEVLKPQQVTIAMKAVMSSSEGEVEFTEINIDEEILQLESYLPQPQLESYLPQPQLESYLPQPDDISITSSSDDELDSNTDEEVLLQSPFLQLEDIPSADNLQARNTASDGALLQQSSPEPLPPYLEDNSSRKLTFANVKTGVKRLELKGPEEVWDILTFMDTGGQPQFISMLPAVNSFAMITFIIHKMKTGGQNSLNEIVEVQYGNEKGEVSHKPHPHKYTHLQLIETLFSYASNILKPDTTFLDKV